MGRSALAVVAAATLLAGSHAPASTQPSSPSAGIPELISRCVDGREIAGPVVTCTRAVEARVGSQPLQELARFSLALARGVASEAPQSIPEPILLCLYEFDLEARIAHCTRAIEGRIGSNELQAMAYHARSFAHCMEGQTKRSIADETRAVALVPNFPAAYAHRAECKQVAGDLEGARADHAQAMRLDPDVPGYYLEGAMLANLLGDHEAALKHLEYGRSRWPRFNNLTDHRAKTLFNLGRYEEAAEAFTETVHEFPGDPFPVLWLHLARLRAGQSDAAEFTANSASLDLTGWTKLMFDYYRGETGYDPALLASRGSDDENAECLAHLFIAEHMLAKKDDMAPAFIGGAVSTCNPGTAPTSAMAAWAELKKISPAFRAKGWSRSR